MIVADDDDDVVVVVLVVVFVVFVVAECTMLSRTTNPHNITTTVCIVSAGDERPGEEPADVVFVIEQKPHDHFVRDGDNIVVEQKLTLRQALLGCNFSVNDILGEPVRVRPSEP